MAQRKKIILGGVVFLGMLALFFALPSRAADQLGLSDDVVRILTKILQLFTRFLGVVLTMLVQAVIWVAQYTDFVNARPVVNGWVIVRDVANMFFIVVLLLIAFGTILGQEEYHYKKLLPKLLILAVLVNFSRTIMGVFIDFGQVIMLTFVNGFKAAAGGNFANLFKIADLLKKAEEECQEIGSWEVFGAFALAFAMVLISVVTIFVIFAVLALRIIMLWLLTILSPIAFLAGTFPQGQKYYAQWWEEFKNQVMAGPMLAFFIWLALITVGGGQSASELFPEGAAPGELQIKTSCSAVGSTDSFITYIIGIFMLLAGVQMSQQMGGAISGIAGRAKGIGEKFAKMGAGMLLGPALFGMKHGAKYGAKRLDDGQANAQRWFANTRLGRTILPKAFAKRLTVHGIQLRTLPAAWKLRSERVEKERVAESMSVAYDLLNRTLPLNRTKSDFTSIARGQAVHAKMEELKAGGTEHEIIRGRLINDVLDKNGVLKKGKEVDLEAILTVLMENHDPNEFIKDPTMSAFVNKALAAKEGRTISDEEARIPMNIKNPAVGFQEAWVRYVSHAFGGDSQDSRRALNRLGHHGFENSDDWSYKISEMDPSTEDYELTYNPFELDKMKKEGKSEEEIEARRQEMATAQAENAAAHAAKRTGRINMTNMRGQSLFKEIAGHRINPETGKEEQVRSFEELTEMGKANLRYVFSKALRHFGYQQPELIKAEAENVDYIYDYLDKDFGKMSGDEQKGIAQFVGFLMGGEKQQEKMGGEIYTALKERVSTDPAVKARGEAKAADLRRQVKQTADSNRDHENIEAVRKARSKGKGVSEAPVSTAADKAVKKRGIIDEEVKEKGQQAFGPGHQQFTEAISAKDLEKLRDLDLDAMTPEMMNATAALTGALQGLAQVLRQKVQELDRVGKTGVVDRETGQEMSHQEAFEGSRIGQALQTVFDEQEGVLRTPIKSKRDTQYDDPPATGENEKEKAERESKKEETFVKYEEEVKTFLRSLHTLASEAATPHAAAERTHEASPAAQADLGELAAILDRLESTLDPGKRATATAEFQTKAETAIPNLISKVDKVPAKAGAVRDLGALKRGIEELKQGTAHLKILTRDDLNKLRKFLRNTKKSV